VPATGITVILNFEAPVPLGLVRIFFSGETPPPTIDCVVQGEGGWQLSGGRVQSGGKLAYPYASLAFAPLEAVLGSDLASRTLLGSSPVAPSHTILYNNGKLAKSR